MATRDWQTPLTVDGLLAAVRDDDRYAAVRDQVTITVEVAGTFSHLVDGAELFSPAQGDLLVRAEELAIEILEGQV